VQGLAPVDAAAVDERPVSREAVVDDGPLAADALEHRVRPRNLDIRDERDV
jgi:hypothetical protein